MKSPLRTGWVALSLILLGTSVGCEALWGGYAVWNNDYCGSDQCQGREPVSDATASVQDMATAKDQDDGDQDDRDPLVFVVGAKGTILRRTESGWQRELAITSNDLIRVHGSGREHVVAVGKLGTILDGN